VAKHAPLQILFCVLTANIRKHQKEFATNNTLVESCGAIAASDVNMKIRPISFGHSVNQ
jgi:hypothetical protein